MPNEKSLENLKRGRKFTADSDDVVTKNAQSKGGINGGKARSAKAMFNRLLEQCPEDVLSGKALNQIRQMGVDPNGKTFLELGAMTTLLQWTLGDMRAGKLAMEISGNDAAAERGRLERERLKLEKEKMRRGQDDDAGVGRTEQIVKELIRVQESEGADHGE